MPTFWSKLRGRNYGAHDEVPKMSTAKKKKKSKKSNYRPSLNGSTSDANYYENEPADEYIFNTRNNPRMSTETLEYEDITGMLLEAKPALSDFHNNNTSGSNAMVGGMAHYMPKATQHLLLSSLLEGEKIDDYFQDCRLDHALNNFARFDNYEQPVVVVAQESHVNRENVYESIEPDHPPSPQPTLSDNKRSSRKVSSSKLDILNWPTAPMVTSSPISQPKQTANGRVLMSSSVDSAGEDLEDEDNYVDLQDVGPRVGGHGASGGSGAEDSFDDIPWCSGVDVLY